MGEPKKNRGCLTAAIIVGVLGLLAVVAMVLVPALFWSQARDERMAEIRVMQDREAERQAGTVQFREGAIPKHVPHERGRELTREQFLALMIDEFATELARKEFQRTANGEQVSWLLRAQDIFDRDGVLHGQFTLPYEVVSGNRRRGSSVNVNCEFLPEHKDSLLKVRREEWVIVEGKLSFDGRKASISEARIVDGETPLRAERP